MTTWRDGLCPGCGHQLGRLLFINVVLLMDQHINIQGFNKSFTIDLDYQMLSLSFKKKNVILDVSKMKWPVWTVVSLPGQLKDATAAQKQSFSQVKTWNDLKLVTFSGWSPCVKVFFQKTRNVNKSGVNSLSVLGHKIKLTFRKISPFDLLIYLNKGPTCIVSCIILSIS